MDWIFSAISIPKSVPLRIPFLLQSIEFVCASTCCSVMDAQGQHSEKLSEDLLMRIITNKYNMQIPFNRLEMCHSKSDSHNNNYLVSHICLSPWAISPRWHFNCKNIILMWSIRAAEEQWFPMDFREVSKHFTSYYSLIDHLLKMNQNTIWNRWHLYAHSLY